MATNLQFIKSASGSSVSSLSVTDCFNDSYNVYEIYITSFEQSGTADSRFSLLDSGGSEITDTSYDWAYLSMHSDSSFTEGKNTSQTHFRDFSYDVTNYSDGIGVKIVMYNPYASSSYTFCTWNSSFYDTGTGGRGKKGIGVLRSAETCTGIKFFGDSGTLDNIKVTVYGVK
jgi:hypothetical protein